MTSVFFWWKVVNFTTNEDFIEYTRHEELVCIIESSSNHLEETYGENQGRKPRDVFLSHP